MMPLLRGLRDSRFVKPRDKAEAKSLLRRVRKGLKKALAERDETVDERRDALSRFAEKVAEEKLASIDKRIAEYTDAERWFIGWSTSKELGGVRYTVEDAPRRRVRGGSADVERIVSGGKVIGTIETLRKGGKKTSKTCSRKLDTCKKGRDLVWLLEAGGLMGARRRR